MASALPKLTAETNADLKLESEGLTSALFKPTEELCVEEERIKTLSVERDHCHEAQSAVEAEHLKLKAESEEAHVAFKVINDQYDVSEGLSTCIGFSFVRPRQLQVTSLCCRPFLCRFLLYSYLAGLEFLVFVMIKSGVWDISLV
ncbi:uncharacterized protein LOC141670399 [Apium graveolens]|uniref:uncharacterized protein LOC141670399 n=1 Tax=Apium graveolens TaxID=4045 RepID=UPI003D79167E